MKLHPFLLGALALGSFIHVNGASLSGNSVQEHEDPRPVDRAVAAVDLVTSEPAQEPRPIQPQLLQAKEEEEQADPQVLLKRIDGMLKEIPLERFTDRAELLALLPVLRKEDPDYVAEIAGREFDLLFQNYRSHGAEERVANIDQLSWVFEQYFLSERQEARRQSAVREIVAQMAQNPADAEFLKNTYLTYFPQDERLF